MTDSRLPPLPQGSVVTVGSFDGVHRGHRAVLAEVHRRARQSGRASVLVTFEPHPTEIVNPAAAPMLLTTGLERREALADTDLDYVVLLRFDRRLAALTPEAFVERILRERCDMRALVIGPNHGFGKGRSGNVDTLRRLGQRLGFEVDVVAPEMAGAEDPISSTRIRRAIGEGDLSSAARWLGRPYTVSGVVGRGAQRGRTIGVPTINLMELSPRKLLPPDGVYAAWVECRMGRFGAMMNQGPRPTVGDGRRTVEAHLFDFTGDLYDATVRVEWVARMREIHQFGSLADLQQQLATDREQARAHLGLGPTKR